MRTRTLSTLVLSLVLAFGLTGSVLAALSLPSEIATPALPEPGGQGGSPQQVAAVSANTPASYTVYMPLVLRNAPRCEEPYLAWASSESAILLRWRTDACTRGAGFRVWREGKVVAQNIRPVTEEAEALALLGSDWAWITSSYPEITSIAQLHAQLANDPLRAEWLANQRYRVAQVLGWAYLDTATLPGLTYTYEVEAVRERVSQSIGSVQVQAGRITPLEAPTGLTTVEVIDHSVRHSPDWVRAQVNRKADRRVYLRWEIPTPHGRSEWPEVWDAGFDIFRATRAAGPYERVNLQWDSDREPEVRAVLPMPANEPAGDVENLAYPLHEFFFVDEDPALEYGRTYFYRVAARDLLGQSRRWPTDASQFSDYVIGVPSDTLPPPPPTDLTVTPLGASMRITWTAQITDAELYRLYRTTSVTASILIDSCSSDSDACWHMIAATPTPPVFDANVQQGVTYWYRVRAIDAAQNLSAFSDAVPGVIHDNEPPCPPEVDVEGVHISIHTCSDASDVERHQLYCSFDDGPLLLIQELTATVGQAHFDISEYYTPPYPLAPACRAQSVDAHGNRSELTEWVWVATLCPAAPISPTMPIINQISTRSGGDYGWTASLAWDTVATAELEGFRIERYSQGENPVEWMEPPESRTFSDATVQGNRVYSYTVTALQSGYQCEGQSFPPQEARSTPYWYKVYPPLDGCCGDADLLVWDQPEWRPGAGTFLNWTHPGYPQLEQSTIIVWRSLEAASGYVALTPPIWAADYEDTSARHPDYWYVVTMLDRAAGEIIAQTPPWYAAGVSLSPFEDALASADAGTPTAAVSELSGVLRPRRYGWPQARVRYVGTSPHRQLDALATLHEWETEAVADSGILASDFNTSYGHSPDMRVQWNVYEEHPAGYALVRFDLEGLPAGASIHTAMLAAHLNVGDGRPVAVGVHPISAPWDELSVTWANQPAYGPPHTTTVVDTTPGWYEWNVTALLQEWHASPSTHHGLLLAGPDDRHYVRTFSTREGDHPPRLVVRYTPPPSVLTFGAGSGDAFELVVQYYAPGSTLDALTGYGSLALGGGGLPVVGYTVHFTNVQATAEGIVTLGQIEVPLSAPLELDYPGGLRYDVLALRANQQEGQGDVRVHLPGANLFLHNGVPTELILENTPIRANLTFSAQRTWDGDCAAASPLYAFEMDPLPLRVAPQGAVSFNHLQVVLSAACTQYRERLSTPWARPPFPAANANDGFLQNTVYTASGLVYIHADGFAGSFSTPGPVQYSTAMPYGFELRADNGVSFSLGADRLQAGLLHDVALTVTHYVTEVIGGHPGLPLAPPPPSAIYRAYAAQLAIGLDGAIYGTVSTLLVAGPDGWEIMPIQWMAGNFVLRNWQNTLYIAPLQTAMLPAGQAYASPAADTRIQPGLNVVTDPGEQVNDFAWYHCDSDSSPPIRFPEGVTADLHLRRSGVSDYISATIPLEDGVGVSLYGYTTTLKTFRMAFCHNVRGDSDVEGDVDLPWPADVIVPLIDMQLDSQACVESSSVREEPLTLRYWHIDLHPTSAAFIKENETDPTWLWIYGALDVPHLTLAREETPTPIPLGIGFTPQGVFHKLQLSPDHAHYSFDGFDWLMESLRLSDWHSITPEEPGWIPAATLASPPEWTGRPGSSDNEVYEGFLGLTGKLIVPYFSTVESKSGLAPELRVLGWENYVGFTQRPVAKRIWDLVVTDHTFDFDLFYTQAYTGYRGAFVGFRQDDWKVVKWDSGVVIAPDDTGIYLGLSSGAAILRAIAELQVAQLPSVLAGDLYTTMSAEWVPRIWDKAIEAEYAQLGPQYLSVLTKIWDSTYPYTQTTERINDKLQDNMPDDPTGGKTPWWLSRLTTLKHLRGAVIFEPVYSGPALIDYGVQNAIVSTWFQARNPTSNEELVQIDQLTFRITNKGDYILHGDEIDITVYGEKIKGDATLLVNIERKRLEGKIALYDLKYPPVEVEIASAVFGVGEDIAYMGALIEAKFEGQPWGGALLFGAIDPASPIVAEMGNLGFAKIFEDIGATGMSGGDSIFTGAYMRVYGSKLVYNKGCVFRIGVGGEVAAWYFDGADNSSAYWGGRLRGYIYGTALCLLSARGDVSLQISNPGLNDQETYTFQGTGWVACGIGFCEPETWDDWSKRWWDDGWCYQCGAALFLDYNKTESKAWHVDYMAECE